MLRRVLRYLVLALTLVLDTVVVPLWCPHWLMPVFTLLTVHCYGLLLGRTLGLWGGLVTGVLVDVSASSPLGMWTVLFALSGYVGGVFGRAFTRSPLTPVLSAAVTCTLVEMAVLGYAFLSGGLFSQAALMRSLARAGLDTVIVGVLYWLLDWLLKPTRSRYAAR